MWLTDGTFVQVLRNPLGVPSFLVLIDFCFLKRFYYFPFTNFYAEVIFWSPTDVSRNYQIILSPTNRININSSENITCWISNGRTFRKFTLNIEEIVSSVIISLVLYMYTVIMSVCFTVYQHLKIPLFVLLNEKLERTIQLKSYL